MTKTATSQTALGVAWLRAAHQIMDNTPLILDDHVAPSLFDARAIEVLRRDGASLESPGARALRSHVVLRSRFAEDRLALAVSRGVRQYIILGAGYDTFCVRQPALASILQITEVDQPATQEDKRVRLENAGLVIPENVAFLAVDFETETLEEAFARFGINNSVKTFFSWLGVTVYLTEEAIDSVLETIANFPFGSEIVLTFAPPAESKPGVAGSSMLAERAAEVGEPWLTYLTSEAIEEKLRANGFRIIEFLTPELAAAKYYAAGGLPAPSRTTIVSAIR